jgi:uncharacterized protein YdhG (YjbR/CyaY superfamily)
MKTTDLFGKLGAPAQRALESAGIIKLSDFGKYSRKEIADLHGIGPSALRLIEGWLKESGKTFKAELPAVKGGMKKGGTVIDDYIARFPKDIQARLSAIRKAIRQAAPEAVEKISYGMPTFYLNGNLVHFAAFKNHIGFYPTPSGITGFEKELKKYKRAKGSAQFPYDEDLPLDLVRKIVEFRVKENGNR